MRTKHCSNAILINGRCVAYCHYILDVSFTGDCTGNSNPIKHGDREVPVSVGFIDGTHKECVHKADGTYTVINKYRPDINPKANRGGVKS